MFVFVHELIFCSGKSIIGIKQRPAKYIKYNSESTPKSDIARHCEARSNPILLIIYMLRLLHFVRNDGKPLFGVNSIVLC